MLHSNNGRIAAPAGEGEDLAAVLRRPRVSVNVVENRPRIHRV